MPGALQDFEPVERTETLGKKVRGELRAAIMAGRFTPGAKLTIRAVAAALDVSLTPAREALYNLAAEGALEMRANGSVYIHELTEESIGELAKIRVALESLAAREAASRISDAEIAQAVDLNDQLTQADSVGDYDKLIDLNWKFHFLIYGASGMPQLLRMIEGCWLKTGSYLNVIYPRFAEVDDGIRNHRRIVEALKARDAEGLAEAIRTDTEYVTASLLAMVTSEPQD